MANFAARITAELVYAESPTRPREFEIDAKINGKVTSVVVTATEFERMNWVIERLGAEAIVGAGFGVRDEVRAASKSTTYRVHHLSSTLSRYALPRPPKGELLRNAIRISLGFLDLAPDRITFPLYAGMWRVMIDVVRFSLFIVGPSGLGKTELTAALVQHFGPGLDSEHLPESFASTTFAVAAGAPQAGNVVYPVDDYVPGGSPGKNQRLHDQAEHLIRSQGNRVGRNRCNRDGSTQGGRESRGLYCITGEDTPHGESFGARYFNLEAHPGDILDLEPDVTTKSEKLRLYQDLARQGYPAMASAVFLQLLASDYERHRDEMDQQKLKFGDTSFRRKAAHPRVIDIAADMLAGLDTFLFFALEFGAIDDDEFTSLWTGPTRPSGRR